MKFGEEIQPLGFLKARKGKIGMTLRGFVQSQSSST